MAHSSDRGAVPRPVARCYDAGVPPISADALADAIDEYRRATPGSAALYEKAAARLPAGVTSNVKFFAPYPIYMTRGEGARLWDVDGREYMDYCLAYGPLVTGHGHPRVLEAVRAEIARAGTLILGAPSDLELRLADRIAALLPSAEMVRFTSSGTEATLHALRIARGATGRSRVVKFEGHYHGVHDHVLWNLDQPLPPKPAADGIPAATAAQTVVLPWNDVDALVRGLDEADDVAAVIVEPVARGVLHPDPAFLQALRAETARRGIVLIFDEVVVWPRVGLGGAQGLYGVTPDLTALGKAIGGGLPLGALAGRRDLMALTIPRTGRRPDEAMPYVFHGGTYNGTPIALAAGLATLNVLEEPGVVEGLDARAAQLRDGLAALGARHGVPLQVLGRGSVVDFYVAEAPIRTSRDVWRSDLARRRALDYRLLAAGVYNAPVHRYHLSLAHTEADIASTLDRVERALVA
jgi:glutamate-1-semialdehyde 2,1-aminomutase